MDWKLGQAKQSLSEVVELAAREPQRIFKRDKPAVFVVDFAMYEEFMDFRTEHTARSVADAFSELRTILAKERYELPISPRKNRKSKFP